ncbi:MAG: methyltransferase [Verrucomicrobiota bacterium]
MSHASKLLGSALRPKIRERGVVWIDENTRIRELEKAFSTHFGLYAVTNRLDLANGLEHWAKGRVRFNDFLTKGFQEASLDWAGLRVSKEKALTHHAINQSWRLLKSEGKLVLSGNRNEGIKSYVQKAEALLGSTASVKTTPSGARLAVIEKGLENGEFLDDRKYPEFREFEGKIVERFVSKPGIFGWNKEDEGSRLLIKHARDLRGKSVLDIGCGYGLLSIAAANLGASRVVATDNCAGALMATERNLKKLNTDFEVIASDAGKEIAEKFDIVLCNPPFHQGKSEQRGLTRKFGRNIAKRLKVGGVAYVVVNTFISFEKENTEFFPAVEELANDGRFKVLRCLLSKVG